MARLNAIRPAILMGLVALSVLLVSCSSSPPIQKALDAAPAIERSTVATWVPGPQSVAGLSVLASPVMSGNGVQIGLHTTSGDVTFWTGVNLGSTTPGHSPGELAMSRADFDRWIGEMGDLGVHFLRIYTLLPPSFYAALLAYNNAHSNAPIYLVQGVYLPDESYTSTGNLFAVAPTSAFTQELADLSAAVSGDFSREKTPGRASGVWSADVSPWLASWIIGAELDPEATKKSDDLNANSTAATGAYFESSTDASPTEIWYAQRMDELAGFEVKRGRSAPIAFINWPTTDPLEHPTEPSPKEDLVGIDANHVIATSAYPGGTFASYHAYPYYPDFLRYTPDYAKATANGKQDAYVGYLEALKAHHAEAGLATMVTEFGVPSAIGSAHQGTNGRDQGAHSERSAMQIDADLTRAIHEAGMAGALVFSWSDEWFKRSWNTMEHQDATATERRSLWHDPLTNEQWFGLMATDPKSVGWRTIHESRTGVRSVAVNHDESYIDLKVTFDGSPTKPVTLGFNVLGGKTTDVQVVMSPAEHTARAYVRTTLDPILMDGLDPTGIPAEDLPGWRVQRLAANRSYPDHPAELIASGNLVSGNWNPASRLSNSMATWNLDGATLNLRLPWSMLLLGDPSTHTAVTPGSNGKPMNSTVGAIKLTIDEGSGPQQAGAIAWENWNKASYSERIKPGVDALAAAWSDTGQ
ncbi:MAG: hypothetical protein Q7L55_08780 [Actinomycetota bacterium]|nr:hypothetical protein [Actinomycetota bacterium]